jgi:septation ring formation regulator EzrA
MLAQAPNDEPKLDDSLTERDLLFRIARELTSIRKLNAELVKFMRDAETEVPESLRRFANYMHDIHDIRYMYEEVGTPVPQHVKDELQRCDDRYRQVLKTLHTDGGALEKIRREMSSDPENRWDHTKQLEFKRHQV